MKKPGTVCYRVEGTNFVCSVTVRQGYIVATAPLLKKFIGEPFTNLSKWNRVLDIQLTYTDQALDIPDTVC